MTGVVAPTGHQMETCYSLNQNGVCDTVSLYRQETQWALVLRDWLFFIPVGSYTAIHADLCPQTASVKGSKRKKLSWHSCFNIQILHRSDTVTASKVYLSLSLILSQNYLLVRIFVWMVAVVNLTVGVICITIRWSPKHFQIRTQGRGGRERT